MSIFSQLFANTENSHLQTLVSEGAFLVDVRTSEIYFRAKWNARRVTVGGSWDQVNELVK